MTAFGEKLRELRRVAGLTQEELAAAAGLSARSVQDLERGRRGRPQRRTVQRLVSALGLADAEAAMLLAAGRTGSRVDPSTDEGAAGAGLLERQDQWAVLERAADLARTRQGAVVWVQAGAGMGKTSLLHAWAAAQHPREIRVAWASGAEPEQDFAFSVLRQLAEPLLARAGHTGRERLLSGPARPASHALGAQEAGQAGELSPEASQGLLHSLYWLMVHITDDGPVALVVDDAHWADTASVRWLEYLARRLGGLPLLLVLAGRPDAGPRVAPLLEQIARQPSCMPVELTGLGADSVAGLVRTSLGQPAEPGFVAACARATDGSPLLLGSLLRTLADNGVLPTDKYANVVEDFRGRILAGTVVKRLTGQPEPVVRLARALAVLGDGAAWHVTAELAGLSEAQARELGRGLQRIGVLAPGEPPRFDHPLIRAAVTEAVAGPVELAAEHARAAELLRREGATDDLVAAHLLLAEPDGQDWRVAALRQAAQTTRRRGAAETTVTYLRRALREPVSAPERGPLLLELGKDELQVDVAAARHHLAQAQAALADPYSRADAAYRLGTSLFLAHQHENALGVLGRAVEDLERTDDGTGLAREVSWFLQAQMVLIGYDQLSTLPAARRHARRLWDYRLAGDTPGQCVVLAALSGSAVTGDASAAVTNDLLDRALKGGLAGIDTSQILVSLAGLAFVATDRLDDAAAQFDQIADVGGRFGSFLMVSAAMTWQLLVHTRRGHQIPLTGEFGHPSPANGEGMESVTLAMTTLLGESLIERSDLPSATAVLARDAGHDKAGWAWQGLAHLARARLHQARGNPAAALTILLEYGAQEKRAHVANLAMTPWRSRAAALHLALGQRTDALQLATEELELAHHWGTERAIGVASRALGTVQGGREGLALLHESVTLLERSPARLELARAQYQLATALQRADQTDQARHTLSQALDLADTCGSIQLAERARTALTALGVRTRPAPAPAPLLSLTQHRLTELLRAGHTDRQIAQALLLTPQDVTGLIDQIGRTPGTTSTAEPARPAQPERAHHR
ncbi:AAA family ATPase [Kitasatospora aureofaciens]|uniref:AAA family ATPase n=1 Tax=Kitasatospora aureofaciens TaxID=1894 RepID=UPI001C453EF0|nr:AAA family ATPase [Kitasatospora aureofaciens]MBV6702935.1 AAA family ATPase [Kitasatospora aureofaciens]